MKKADRTRIPLECFLLPLGFAIGIAVSVMGESKIIPPMGIPQSVADGLYVNETGDTMTGPLVLPDGTKTAPGLAFDDGGGNLDTGIYNVAAKGLSVMHFTVNDTDVANLDNTVWTVNLDLVVDGTAWLGSADTGDNVVVRSNSGIDYQPPTDVDTDLISVQVTGVPRMWWDESADSFAMTRPLIVPNLPIIKSGTVAGASFAGNPKIFTVTFNTAFPDTNYSVSVISEESRSWTFQSKLAGSFVMNSNANLALTLNVDWIATAHNDP